MNLLPFPYVPLSKRCTECGEWKMSTDLEDGRCARCLGRPLVPIVVHRHPEPEPKDWWLSGCTWPGVSEGPWTLIQATELARLWGGRVKPWARRTVEKDKALGTYPHAGQMRSKA